MQDERGDRDSFFLIRVRAVRVFPLRAYEYGSVLINEYE